MIHKKGETIHLPLQYYFFFNTLRYFFCVAKLTTTIVIDASGKAKRIGSTINQGYVSINTSLPNIHLHKPIGTASALCRNNIANRLAEIPTHKLAKAPCFVALVQ